MELKGILENNDFTVVLQSSRKLGNKLTRHEIEDVISENGLVNPVSNISFIIQDAVRTFTVMYTGTDYNYIKLNKAK